MAFSHYPELLDDYRPNLVCFGDGGGAGGDGGDGGSGGEPGDPGQGEGDPGGDTEQGAEASVNIGPASVGQIGVTTPGPDPGDPMGDIGGAVGPNSVSPGAGPGVGESMGDIGAAATGGMSTTGSANSPSNPGGDIAMTIAKTIATLLGMTPVGLGLNVMGDGPLGLGLMHHGSPTDPSVAANPAGIGGGMENTDDPQQRKSQMGGVPAGPGASQAAQRAGSKISPLFGGDAPEVRQSPGLKGGFGVV